MSRSSVLLRRVVSCATAALAAAVFVCAAVPASAQSLADIAKKEQARRKALEASKAPPKKVYTNDDLKPPATPARPAAETPAAAAPAGTPEEQSAEQQAAGDQATPQDEQGEEYWRGRINQAREALRRNELFLDALQSRVNALSTDFVNRDDPYQRAQIADDRQKALAEMDRVKQDIETVKKQIADIEEEARKAGVPPGWLR